MRREPHTPLTETSAPEAGNGHCFNAVAQPVASWAGVEHHSASELLRRELVAYNFTG